VIATVGVALLATVVVLVAKNPESICVMAGLQDDRDRAMSAKGR